jgi:hypothetical protein
MSIFQKLSVDHMFGEHFMPRASLVGTEHFSPFWESKAQMAEA